MEKNRGVTLVELSIVLVIIGLLVAGVIEGQRIIDQAGISRAITQIQDLNTAVSAFQTKYDYLPGDIPNATSFFPNCPVNSGASPYPTTCNGNGDGLIVDANNWERSYFFTHLALAGLISGNYNFGGTNLAQDIPDIYATFMLIDNSFIIQPDRDIANGSAYNGLGFRKNGLEGYMEGHPDTGNTNLLYAIDQKLDDGNAMTGIMRVFNGGAGTCYNGTTGDYIVNVVAWCIFAMKTDW